MTRTRRLLIVALLVGLGCGLGYLTTWSAPQITLPPPAADLSTATGNLPVTKLNSGTGATSSTFWRGDGTWAAAGGGPGTGTQNRLAFWDTTSTLGSSLLSTDGTNVTLSSGKFVVTSGTHTTSQPGLDLTQTWNASGVTFTGVKSHITDTASAAASLLLDLQVGGTSQFSVGKGGVMTVGAGGSGQALLPFGTASTPGISFNADANTGLFRQANDQLGFATGGSERMRLSSAGILLLFSDDLHLGASSDVRLARDAANTLAIRNAANAQTTRIYGTFTDASNYERLSLSHVTGTGSLIAAQTAGSGGDNLGLILTPAGTGNVALSSGHLLFTTDNTYDLGASGATRPRSGYFGTNVVAGDTVVAPTLSASSFLQVNGYTFYAEVADAGVPAANTGTLYLRDTGGKSELVIRFPTGAVQQIAIEP